MINVVAGLCVWRILQIALFLYHGNCVPVIDYRKQYSGCFCSGIQKKISRIGTAKISYELESNFVCCGSL